MQVLQPAPKPQTKPQRNSPPSLLPPIAHGPGGHRGAQRGQPAMFNAAGPIPSFPMQGALHDPDRRHKANIPYHSALPTQLPPLKHNPAPTSEGAMRAPLLPPISSTDGGSVGNNMGEDGLMLGPGREPSFSSSPTNNHSQGRTSPGPHDSLNDASMPQQPPHIQMLMQQQEKQAQESQSPEKSQRMSHASAGDAFKGSPPLHHSPNAAVVLHPFNLAGAAAAGHLPPLPKAHYSNIGPKVQAQNKPGRDLQLELAVLKVGEGHRQAGRAGAMEECSSRLCLTAIKSIPIPPTHSIAIHPPNHASLGAPLWYPELEAHGVSTCTCAFPH